MNSESIHKTEHDNSPFSHESSSSKNGHNDSAGDLPSLRENKETEQKEDKVVNSTSADLDLDAPSPPPLSCIGTLNVYNVDLGLTVWDKSNEEDIFSADSMEQFTDNEVVFTKGDLRDESLHSSTDTISTGKISNTGEIDSEISDKERKALFVGSCDNDINKNDSDDDFGDFEGTSFTWKANLEEHTQSKYDSSMEFHTEDENIIKIPTLYPNNDEDGFTAFDKSQNENDFNSIPVTKNDSDDDFEFGTFATFDSGNFGDDEEKISSEQLPSIDRTASHSEFMFDSDHIPVLTKTDDIPCHSNEVLEKLDNLISRWLGEATKNENNKQVSLLSQYVEEDAFIWHHLLDVESSLALKLNWNSLSSKKNFLHSLDVDARNILYKNKWNTSIPIFAQTLSFSPLTPARCKKTESNWKTDEIPNLPEPVAKQEKSNEGIIPPAKFDWSSSGLTNPLETPGIEKEILTAATQEAQNDKCSIIQRLMESQSKANKITPLSTMKPDVKKVISQLPDLNYMKAKVFMFPINQS